MNFNIVFAVDNNGFDMMAVALYSVIKNNRKQKISFYIFHQNVTKENLWRLKKLEKKYANIKIKPIGIGKKRFKDTETNNIYVTTEAYFRYLAPEILHEESRALYMDFDMLCIAALDELYNTDLGNNFIGATPDYVVEHDLTYQKFKKGIGFGAGEIYANSGLQLMDLEKLRSSGAMDVFWQNLQDKNKIIPQEFNFFADQTVMNLSFKGKIKFLNPRYNVFTTVLREMKQKSPVIVHFTGLCKPLTYRNESTAVYDDMYYSYYRECAGIIGDNEGNLLKNILKKLSQEAGDTPMKLKINNELRLQVESAAAHIRILEERIALQNSQIQEERRFKNAFKNLLRSIDRKITGLLDVRDGSILRRLLFGVPYYVYRLIRRVVLKTIRAIKS